MSQTNPDDIKIRLEKDENMWTKVQMQQNRHHSDTLNQLADLFKLVRQIQAKVNKNEKAIKDITNRFVKANKILSQKWGSNDPFGNL
jgi:uncharacterized protein YlxW (UPF0749 family)